MCVYDVYVHIYMHAMAQVVRGQLGGIVSDLPWVLVIKFRLPGLYNTYLYLPRHLTGPALFLN